MGCCCCCRLLGTTGIINNGWGEPTPRRAKLAYSLPLFMNAEGVLARSYSHSHSQSSLLIVINNCINATAFADKLSIIHLAISHPHCQHSWVVFDSCKQVLATFAELVCIGGIIFIYSLMSDVKWQMSLAKPEQMTKRMNECVTQGTYNYSNAWVTVIFIVYVIQLMILWQILRIFPKNSSLRLQLFNWVSDSYS